MEKASILVVAVTPDVYEQIAPLLRRRSFEVDRIADPRSALELMAAVSFDSVIVGYPLNGLPLVDFLNRVRSSASALASVAALVPRARMADVEGLRDALDAVLPQEEAADQIQRLLCDILGVASRSALRIPVRLEISVLDSESRDLLMTQTEDVSATGMLVHCRRAYPLGSRAQFEMRLSGELEPIKGEAEVARQTEGGIDRVEGMGLRFLAFDGKGEAHFLRHLDVSGTS